MTDQRRAGHGRRIESANAAKGIALGQPLRPGNFVAAALPDRDAYERAVDELVAAGIAPNSIALLQGELGAAAIAEGRRRTRSWLDWSDEPAYLERYEEAARQGSYVVGVPLTDGGARLRTRVASILAAHGGGSIVSRSRWTHEEVSS